MEAKTQTTISAYRIYIYIYIFITIFIKDTKPNMHTRYTNVFNGNSIKMIGLQTCFWEHGSDEWKIVHFSTQVMMFLFNE